MSEPVPAGGSALARLARNGALSASAEVLSKLCSLLFFVLVARELGGNTLGHYVFAMAMTSLVWSFAGFGLDRLAMRDIARDPAAMGSIAVPMAAMKAGAALAIVLVCAAVLQVAGEDAEVVWLVLILGTGIALAMTAATAQTVCAAHERMDYVFLLKVPWAIVSALLGSAVVIAGGGIVAASIVSSLVVGAIGTVWAWIVVNRNFGALGGGLRVRDWPRMLREAVPFGLQEMLGQIIFRFDTVLLAAVAASQVVGAYGAAYRMLESTLFIAWSVGYAVQPMFSYLPQGHELSRIFEGALKLVLCVMAPLAAVLLVCAPAIIDLIYGRPEYDTSIGVLRLLAPAVAVYSIGHLAGLIVLVRRPGRITVTVAAVVTVVNVAACAILIPLIDAHGAAISTLIGEGLLAVLGLWLARRVTGRVRLFWVAGSPLLAAAVMAVAMWPLADELWLALPAGAAAYVVALLALEASHLREDIALFKQISGRRPDLAAMLEEPVAP
jgi:O-antigen/teichoic acid export membrane protein